MSDNYCKRPCTILECSIEKCPADLTAPYVCTFPKSANEYLGCSADPLTWKNNPNCLACCDKTACKQRTCEKNCEYGQCQKGNCICEDDYTGERCDEYKTCFNDNDCKHGQCVAYDDTYKYCACVRGWQGAYCDRKIPCANDSDVCQHGRCVDGTCACDSTHTGEFCDIKRRCADYCKGRCVDEECVCPPNRWGPTCENIVPCHNYCSYLGGTCINNECVCNPGWTGYDCWDEIHDNCDDACKDPGYEEDSVRFGKCVNGECICTLYNGTKKINDFDCSKKQENV